MDKGRPKRLLGLIKKKQPDSKPPQVSSPPSGKGPVSEPSGGLKSFDKEETLKASKVSTYPAGQSAGIPQGPINVPKELAPGPSEPPQPLKKESVGKSAQGMSPPQGSVQTSKTEKSLSPPIAGVSAESLRESVPSENQSSTLLRVVPQPVGEGQAIESPEDKTIDPESFSSSRNSPEVSSTAEDPPVLSSREEHVGNGCHQESLAELIGDHVLRIKKDGSIVNLRDSRSSDANRDSSAQMAWNDADDYSVGVSGTFGLVASSLLEHGKPHINRARGDRTIQDFAFESTLGGRLCHFRCRIAATEDGDVLAVVRDVTGDQLLTNSLAEKKRYMDLFQMNVEGVVVVDAAEGKVRICNEATVALFACREAADLIGADFLEFVCTEDKDRLSSVIGSEVSDVNSGQTVEFRAVTRDGGEIWVRAGVSSTDWNGALARLISLVDVTELRRTEDALHDSQERFNGLVRSTYDWVWEINIDGVYTYVSPRVQDILGYRPEEILGKTPLELMSLEEAERIVGDFSALLAAQEPFDGLEVVCLHKDGHSVATIRSGVPFFSREGKLLGYRGADRSITIATRAGSASGGRDSSSEIVEGMIRVITSVIEARDRYTAMHQQYVARLAVDIATEMGLPSGQLQSIRIAALLHDLGKMCIPGEILNKPGQLSRVESDILKGHPRAGYEILGNIEFPWPVAQMVLQHHERMNGSGYPSGLKGDEILLEARILAVADVVVAMSSHRPYRPAQSLEKALREILENRGSLYDATVVDACMTLASRKGFSFQEQDAVPAASPIECGIASGRAGLAYGL